MGAVVTREDRVVEDPPFVQRLLSNTSWSWVYVPLRLYLAWQWLPAAWSKLNNPAWWQTGDAPKGYWEKALANPAAISQDWYRGFIQFLLDHQLYTLFGKLIPLGELAVGLGLLLGVFTGIAAFGGALMNYNYLLAGTISSNPVLFLLELFILAGWKVAGWWGLDRWLLPALGVPWHLPHRVLTPAPAAIGAPRDPAAAAGKVGMSGVTKG
jgi:thiosulfate dehydrogenase [quinone] large subunit